MAGLLLQTFPPIREKFPPFRTCWGIIDSPTWGWWLPCSTVDRRVGSSNLPYLLEHFDLFPMVHDSDWVNKSHVCSTAIKDPMPLIKKRRALCPGGTLPPSFIHQVITSQYNLYYLEILWHCAKAEGLIGITKWEVCLQNYNGTCEHPKAPPGQI